MIAHILFILVLSSASLFCQTIDTLKTFDNYGNLIKIQCQNEGQLQNHILHYEYNEFQQIVKEYTTDTLGNILPRIGSAPILVYEYEPVKRKKVVTKFCNNKSLEVNTINKFPFYSKVTSTYNSKEQCLERWLFDRYGKAVVRITYSYNIKGLKSEIKYFDADGNIKKESIGIIKYQYDSLDRLIATENYDYQNKPYSSTEIYFKESISYFGAVECKKYFDANLNEIISNQMLNCSTAPNFTISNQNEDSVSLNDFKGKIVVLYFWTSTFSGSKYLNPRLLPFYNKYKNKNVELICIALEKPENKDKWLKALKETEIDWAINLYDLKNYQSDIALKYKIEWLPTLFVINPDGIIVGSHIGSLSDVEEILNKIIDSK